MKFQQNAELIQNNLKRFLDFKFFCMYLSTCQNVIRTILFGCHQKSEIFFFVLKKNELAMTKLFFLPFVPMQGLKKQKRAD